MLDETIQFRPDTFVADVKARLEEGRSSLSWLVAAYNWGQQMLKAIRKCSPTYEHEWLRTEIRATFNLDPNEYLAAARKFGGGRAAHLVQAGERFIERCGLHGALAAARKLNDDEAHAVAQDLAADAMAEDLEKAVKAKLADRVEGGPVRHSYKKDLEAAMAEINRLKIENATLKKENEMLREMLPKRQAS